jgi:sugar-specific transcriptional regulator TrmB
MIQKYRNQLKEYGLSKHETTVYLHLLMNKSTVASAIAKAVDLNRSNTYVQLTNLIAHGLVSSYKVEKKTFFNAESPLNLERLLDNKISSLEKQRTTIKTLLPDLLDAFSTNSIKPIIRTFQGKDGLTSMRNEIFEVANNDRIRIITNVEDLYRVFSPKELEDYSKRRLEQTSLSLVLYKKATGEDFAPFKHQQLKRLGKKSPTFDCDVYIYGDTVSFAAMKQEIVGVSIDQTDIARTMKSLFDCHWEKN